MSEIQEFDATQDATSAEAAENTENVAAEAADENVDAAEAVAENVEAVETAAEEEEEKKPKRGRPRKTDAEKAKPIKRSRKKDWSALILTVDQDGAVDYNIADDFSQIAAINHKTFGLGVITKVLDETKIEVVFEENKKVLAQNWL